MVEKSKAGKPKAKYIFCNNCSCETEHTCEGEHYRDYQNCAELFGERRGVLTYRQLNTDWQPLVPQVIGCMASAWARLAADVGYLNATIILEKE